jgi:hypothetical protein
MKIYQRHSLKVLLVAVVLGFAVAACQNSELFEQGEEFTARPMTTSWSSWAKNVFQPADCGEESLINGAKCRGSRCSDVAVRCVKGDLKKASSYWTEYFSEENPEELKNKRVCRGDRFVTAIRCKGINCGNVQIQCTDFSNVKKGEDCQWTPKVSEEEGGTISFGSSKYVAGVKCHGKRCESLNFLVCDAAITPTA